MRVSIKTKNFSLFHRIVWDLESESGRHSNSFIVLQTCTRLIGRYSFGGKVQIQLNTLNLETNFLQYSRPHTGKWPIDSSSELQWVQREACAEILFLAIHLSFLSSNFSFYFSFPSFVSIVRFHRSFPSSISIIHSYKWAALYWYKRSLPLMNSRKFEISQAEILSNGNTQVEILNKCG